MNVDSDPLAAIEPDPVRRAKLRRIIAQNSPARPSDDPQAGTPRCSGLLSCSTPSPQVAPPAAAADETRGWRRVAALDVTDVLGL